MSASAKVTLCENSTGQRYYQTSLPPLSMPLGNYIHSAARKSRPQEEHYHALINEIAASETLHGQKLPPESWKRLLIDAFKHETRNWPELRDEWDKFGEMQLLPALNHPGFVAVGEQSRKFSKKLAAAFITWLMAFQATGTT